MDITVDSLILSYLLGAVVNKIAFTPYQQLLAEVSEPYCYTSKNFFFSLAINPSRT